jgi:PKD repeat protein
VTGGAALLKGCKANLNSATIKSILLDTVRPDGFLAGNTFTGGVVNYEAAINDPRVGNCDTAPSNSPPVADAGGPYKTSFKKAVQFDGTHSYDLGGKVLLYFWDFGDGTFGAGAKPTHLYSARGTFTLVLTVRDSLGAVASQSTTVTIPPPSHN